MFIQQWLGLLDPGVQIYAVRADVLINNIENLTRAVRKKHLQRDRLLNGLHRGSWPTPNIVCLSNNLLSQQFRNQMGYILRNAKDAFLNAL